MTSEFAEKIDQARRTIKALMDNGVMQQFIDGKTLQIFSKGSWCDILCPMCFDRAPEGYRIKPQPEREPRRIPLEEHEMPYGELVHYRMNSQFEILGVLGWKNKGGKVEYTISGTENVFTAMQLKCYAVLASTGKSLSKLAKDTP